MICAVCGAQTHEVKNVQDEQDFNTVQASLGVRRQAISRLLAPDHDRVYEHDPALESELFLECFQTILKLQCETLIQQVWARFAEWAR
jgi:hypothetical protein